MDRDKVRELRLAIDEALAQVGLEYDCTIAIEGGMRFDDSLCRGKIVARDLKEDGSEVDPDREDFIKKAENYGLKPSDFGRKFQSQGQWYEIVGLKSTRPKYPMNIATGKKYKFDAGTVRRCLE